MTPAAFFNRGKSGNKIKLGNEPDLWEVVIISKGSQFARIKKEGDTNTTFAYLGDGRFRITNLDGPSYNVVEIVQK